MLAASKFIQTGDKMVYIFDEEIFKRKEILVMLIFPNRKNNYFSGIYFHNKRFNQITSEIILKQ